MSTMSFETLSVGKNCRFQNCTELRKPFAFCRPTNKTLAACFVPDKCLGAFYIVVLYVDPVELNKFFVTLLS